MNFFADLSFYGFCILVPITIIIEGRDMYAFFQIIFSALSTETSAGGQASMLWLMLFNGISFTVYNLMSYILLKRTDLITHCVVNVFRRVFTIFFTAVYFQVELNSANIAGVVVAVFGVLLFAYFKSRELRS